MEQGVVGRVTRRVHDMHIVAARFGFERAMVGTRFATSCPDCMDKLRKQYPHLIEGRFLARKAAWPLSSRMTTNCNSITVYSSWLAEIF